MEEPENTKWDPGKGSKRNRLIGDTDYHCSSIRRVSTSEPGCFVFRVYLRCNAKDGIGRRCLHRASFSSSIWPDTPESVVHFQSEGRHTCVLGVDRVAPKE